MIFLLLFIISLLTIQLLTTHHYRKQKPNSDFDFNYFNYYLKHPPIVNEIPSELKTIMRPEQTRTSMMATDDEWLNALRNNKVISVDFNMTKGYSNKYKVYLEGGYVAVAKPVMAIEETSAELPVVDFYQGLDYNKKNGQRTGLVDRRLTQGWSEIAAFHLDRILKFYRKPPITGRIFDNHFFFAFNDSEENMKYRNMKTFDYPMALVGWMDHVHSLYPTYENLGDILLMEVPINKSILSDLKSVSDTIVFDFLVDDHDKHNSQNWVGYVNKGEHFLLFWDSGLAWLHGPEGWDSCKSLLCGPKDWRDRIDGYNDTSCRPICRFNKKTVDNLRLFDNDLGFTLGALLEESLKSDPLFPVFTYGIYHAKIKNETAPKGKSTAYVHFLPENFFAGMDVKVKRFLNHVDQCIEQYGADEVFLPSSKKID